MSQFQKVYAEQREPVFQKRIRTILDMENSLGPIPRNQRILSRPELKELFNGNKYGDLESRNQIIFEAFKVYAYTQSEIAAHLRLNKTTISKIISKPTEQVGYAIIHPLTPLVPIGSRSGAFDIIEDMRYANGAHLPPMPKRTLFP